MTFCRHAKLRIVRPAASLLLVVVLLASTVSATLQLCPMQRQHIREHLSGKSNAVAACCETKKEHAATEHSSSGKAGCTGDCCKTCKLIAKSHQPSREVHPTVLDHQPGVVVIVNPSFLQNPVILRCSHFNVRERLILPAPPTPLRV